ncbi:hypothetical protein SAMN05421740_109158 [Parapedobacter koreensis]|uniref:Uncharacterized protein n=1 Tax=Parapedobacter koreensis TaxID=332977 RepID=A0A1H7SV04_9SPHI|nr:hypothetical protein SAMN05421740_109158 [Parapedobacter koreensis]
MVLKYLLLSIFSFLPNLYLYHIKNRTTMKNYWIKPCLTTLICIGLISACKKTTLYQTMMAWKTARPLK